LLSLVLTYLYLKILDGFGTFLCQYTLLLQNIEHLNFPKEILVSGDVVMFLPIICMPIYNQHILC